jgi:hypothetical protein
VFESIRRQWAEARANVVSKQVEDMQRYERMNPNDRYWVSSGFDAVLTELEEQLGPVAQWDADHKKQVAKQIMQGAQQAFGARGDNMSAEATRLHAHGGALVSCYLELQTLPSDQADSVTRAIEGWRKRAQTSGPYATRSI